jgi:hypothetical protein
MWLSAPENFPLPALAGSEKFKTDGMLICP